MSDDMDRDVQGAPAASRRGVVAALLAAPLIGGNAGPSGPVPAPTQVFTPEMFGAKGDGATNDTLAFQRLSRAINDAGGGTIELRKVTYVIGRQLHAPESPGGFAYVPEMVLQFLNCPHAITIRGNNARLRCAPGLRFGVFDPGTGQRLDRPMPNLREEGRATPYRYAIWIEGCSGGITINDLELDGNAAAAVIGGPWGDTGWQIPHTGLYMYNNVGPVSVTNLYTHHHLQDGMMISDRPGGGIRRFANVRAQFNGRQGCSIIGGDQYRFADCDFSHTGRSVITSMPGCGVDIEAERSPIRDLSFARCRFYNNATSGMAADTGDSARATFVDCHFIGTTAWAAYPNKPFFRFERCLFVGAICRTFSSPDPAAAAHFTRCVFTDDPAKSPNGKVLNKGPIADLSDSENVLFERCAFLVSHGAALPWSSRVIYADCTMRQANGPQGYPRGTYRGRCTIVGNVDLANSKILGTLTINGTVRPRTG